MRRVRCPRCSAIIAAAGTHAVCSQCGLSGRIGGQPPAAPAGDGPAEEKHPLRFTVDLRKASPTHWSPGAKSFAVLLLLAGAFLLGGYAGMAFERTRNDIGAGINEVKSLAGDQEAAGAGGSGGSAGTVGDAGDGASGDGSDASGTGMDGDSGDLPTSGADNGTDGSGDGADASGDGSDGPDASGGEGAPNGAEETLLSESGVGEWESSAFTTHHGLVRVDIDYWGDRFFALKFMQPGEIKPAATVSASDQGDYDGVTRYIALPEGEYRVRIDLGAGDVQDGPWNLDIFHPVPDAASDVPYDLRGRGDGGFGPVRLTGDHTVAFESTTEGSAHVKAYTAGGTYLSDCSLKGTASSTQPIDASTACSVDGETWVFFDIAAPSDDDPGVKWELRID